MLPLTLSIPSVGIPLTLCASLILLKFDLRRRQVALRNLLQYPPLLLLDLLTLPLTAGLMIWCLLHITGRELLSTAAPALLAFVGCSVGLLILWNEGRQQIQFQRPIGILFAEWLCGFGCSLTLMFALTPGARSPLTPFALVPLLAGIILGAVVAPPFYATYEGLRILERVGDCAAFVQPEYTPRPRNARNRNSGIWSTRKPPSWKFWTS